MLNVQFSMTIYKKSMLRTPLVLKILICLIMYLKLNKASYGWYKLQYFGMTYLAHIYLRITFKAIKLNKYFLLKLMVKIFLLFMYMLMISCLELLMILYARNFLRLRVKNLKWSWWETWHSLLDFNETKEEWHIYLSK